MIEEAYAECYLGKEENTSRNSSDLTKTNSCSTIFTPLKLCISTMGTPDPISEGLDKGFTTKSWNLISVYLLLLAFIWLQQPMFYRKILFYVFVIYILTHCMI